MICVVSECAEVSPCTAQANPLEELTNTSFSTGHYTLAKAAKIYLLLCVTFIFFFLTIMLQKLLCRTVRKTFTRQRINDYYFTN